MRKRENDKTWRCCGHAFPIIGPIYHIKKAITKGNYVNILQTIMLPHAEDDMPLIWKFQQDNDPKRTAQVIKKIGSFKKNI